MRTTKDMDFIYSFDGEEISIELTQKSTREDVIKQYVDCRKAKKMTQDELSKIAGVSRPNISRFESGRYNPSLEMMVRLAAALEMDVCVKLEAKKQGE